MWEEKIAIFHNDHLIIVGIQKNAEYDRSECGMFLFTIVNYRDSKIFTVVFVS